MRLHYTETAAAKVWDIGMPVLARWRDGEYYPATVMGQTGDKVTVKWDDAEGYPPLAMLPSRSLKHDKSKISSLAPISDAIKQAGEKKRGDQALEDHLKHTRDTLRSPSSDTLGYSLTENERKMIVSVYNCHYGNDGDDIWSWAHNDSRKPHNLPKTTASGVIASLVKKKLMHSFNDGADSTCGLTKEGQMVAEQLDSNPGGWA